MVDFSVEQALEGLSSKTRKRVIRLFLRRKIRTGAEAVLLTQQFSNQGVLGEKEQLRLYAGLPGWAAAGDAPAHQKAPRRSALV